MTNNKYLRVQLAVLLAQYGEREVVQTLASLRPPAIPNPDLLLADIQKNVRTRAMKNSANRSGASLEALLNAHPDKAQIIRELNVRFDNRTFLPEFKDVRRFLDRHGQSSSSLKSRGAAFIRIAHVLVERPVSDLQVMLSSVATEEFSSLGVISDQILGRK